MARSAQDLIPNGVNGVLERDTINTVPPMHLQHFLGFIGSDPNGLILLKQADSPIHANQGDIEGLANTFEQSRGHCSALAQDSY